MFSNAIIYRISESWDATASFVEDALQKRPFITCARSEEQSEGWSPPRGEENGLLLESVGGQWVMRFSREQRPVPAYALARVVQEKADAIEKEFGRKPGKAERKDLKDEAKRDLLLNAFPKLSRTWVWLDPIARLLVIDTASQGVADVIVTDLVEGLKGFGVALLYTQSSPEACMAHWLLSQEAPAGFTIDRACVLKASDESKAIVRYTNHPLDIEEVKEHVQQYKLPQELAMTWDDRVSFVLSSATTIKKITFTDSVLKQAGEEGGFDTDVAIATGELSKMFSDVITALGGLDTLQALQPELDLETSADQADDTTAPWN